MDNDKTIGRTNVRSGSGAAASALSHSSSYASSSPGTTNNNQPAAVPLGAPSSSSSAAAPPPPPSITSPGGTFQWPTSADSYSLSERIGQGAFASVWSARIKTSAGGGESKGEEDGEGQVECAIKIMDLEHVNINISGEYCVVVGWEQ